MTTITEYEAMNQFEEIMNDTYGFVDVCGVKMEAGTVLREMDPICFREDMRNFFDSENIEII